MPIRMKRRPVNTNSKSKRQPSLMMVEQQLAVATVQSSRQMATIDAINDWHSDVSIHDM